MGCIELVIWRTSCRILCDTCVTYFAGHGKIYNTITSLTVYKSMLENEVLASTQTLIVGIFPQLMSWDRSLFSVCMCSSLSHGIEILE